MARRKGSIRLVCRGRMRMPSWQAAVVVDGHKLTRQTKDRGEAELWLATTLGKHPGYTTRPVKPDHIRVLECCQTLKRKTRPDVTYELVKGWDPRDIAEELGWRMRRVRAALEVCVEKGCLDENLTPVGRGAARRMERLYTRHTAVGRRNVAV